VNTRTGFAVRACSCRVWRIADALKDLRGTHTAGDLAIPQFAEYSQGNGNIPIVRAGSFLQQ
jgi:hypothetical protein